jgi:hypothetical protein
MPIILPFPNRRKADIRRAKEEIEMARKNIDAAERHILKAVKYLQTHAAKEPELGDILNEISGWGGVIYRLREEDARLRLVLEELTKAEYA